MTTSHSTDRAVKPAITSSEFLPDDIEIPRPASKIIRVLEADPVLEHTIPDNILEGQPVKKWADLYVDDSRQYAVGVWQSNAGKWEKTFHEDELVVVVSGVITLTGEDGVPHTFKAGEMAIILKGFKGTWETVEPVFKIYASFEYKEPKKSNVAAA